MAIKLSNKESGMSGLKVKLTSKQEYKGTEYAKNTVLTVSPEVANSLISRGLAEKHLEARVVAPTADNDEVADATGKKSK